MAPWAEVLGLFGLPRPTSHPEPIVGGWSHSVWRAETTDGAFAIKEMVDHSAPWWINQLSTATAFERTAWRSRVVAMAEPVPVAGTDELLGVLDGVARRYRCHRWVDGEPSTELTPDVGRSRQVGKMVANLALLGIGGGTSADQLPWNALDAYEDTVEEAHAKRLDWAPALADLQPRVSRLRQEFTELAEREEPFIVLHRDIDPKNTVMNPDGGVVLLDWDNAGPRMLASEVFDAAISFAGGPLAPNEACLFAAVDSYRDSGGPPLRFNGAASVLAEAGFRWVMLNAWRCLGHRGVPADQAAFAGSIVRELAPVWPGQAAALDHWEDFLRDP